MTTAGAPTSGEIRPRLRLWTLQGIALALVLVGCGVTPSNDASDDADKSTSDDGEQRAPGDGDGDGPGVGTAADAGTDAASPDSKDPAPPCDPAETTALQASLDGAHDAASTDVVLSVKTPSCGVRFFSSGPSKYGPAVLHRIASNTKMYVASLILELHADGLLSLSDPASKWFDGVPGGDAIKVEHLLWQTSGIAHYEDNVAFFPQVLTGKVWKPMELVQLSLSMKTSFAPGTSWEYCNANYTMLGVIAEKVSGKPLAELLHERIYAKLGLTATFSAYDEPLVGDLAKGKTPAEMHPTTFWGAGHLVASPGDLLAWTESRGNGTFHDAATNAYFQKQYDWKPERAGWRYGPGTIILDGSVTSGGGKGYGHGGDLPGYHSMAFYFPDKDVTVVEIFDADGAVDDLRRPFFASLETLFGAK